MAELFDIVSIFAVCKMLSLVYSVDYNESIEVWSKKEAPKYASPTLLAPLSGTVWFVPFLNVLRYPLHDLTFHVTHS